MNIEWIEVSDSKRIIAAAYLPEESTICVRFPDGVEWCYSECSPEEWDTFLDPATSKGQYIARVLNQKPHQKLVY